MSYLHQSNRERDRLNRPTRITAIIIGLIVLVHVVFPEFFPSFVFRLLKPIWLVQHDVQVLRDPFAAVASSTPEVLKAENEFLKIENENLKAMLGRPNAHEEILAAILTTPPQSPYDTIIIDVGHDHGVQEGKDVYASSTLIGRTIDVYDHSSKVVLFSSPGQTYDVLLGTTSVQATAIGKGSGVYEAIIPREFKIVPGDPVVIPSLYGGLFGVVESVAIDPVRAFVTVYFKTPINIREIRWVTVKK